MVPEEIRKRVLKLHEGGYGIRWIARHTKLSRNTVRRILGLRSGPDVPKPKRASLLDPYKKRIEELVTQDEIERRANRRRKPLTATRIFKEIRKSGYSGGRTIVDDYVRTLRGPHRRSRKPFRRFETPPAEECQQDWSPYRVKIAGREVRIEVFSLILCWSRYQFLRAYLDQKLPTLLYGHVAAFKYFQGVPWKIVYDHQATITPFDIGGKPVLTDGFREFKAHYGFDVFICNPGDKERKGKIERPFEYFETSFLPLRCFESLEDLNRQLLDWLEGDEYGEEGNRRKHGTTAEVPYERWLEEKEFLFELPSTDHLPRRVEERLVNKDCTVSVEGSLYTVPARLVEEGARHVWVSIGEDDFLVYDKKGEIVARHRISEEKGKLIIDEAHYEGMRRRRHSVPRPELERLFLERFPGATAFLEALKRTLRSVAPIHLRELLALARRYRRDEVEAALETALCDGTATSGYVRQILSQCHPTAHLGELHREPPKGLSLGPVDPGNAEGYDGIFSDERREEDR